MSRTRTPVVKMLPSSTTNITGFLTMWRGLSLMNASPSARRTSGGSKRGRLVMVMSEEPPGQHRELLDDRSERESGEEGEGAHDENDAHQKRDEERRRDGEGAH